MNLEEYRRLTQKPETKYHSRKTVIDGHTFDSQLEANRYVDLKRLKRAGKIKGFGIQPSFVLPGGIRYRPDFIVCGADGTIWVEDAKGKETKDFILKRKLWEEAYPWLELKIVR
ncbi:DUF1064 domain-containing protein [Papillibacter cinnamivorans]|uniref:DUF1064 domain-containing protein n=1 Tax=Papillibacter cinnamivorans DSM 12816 TaxID=1122930 RepID=A0A1W1YQE8_9FIRM|nr:DUF1064 domain-containing protein [Papillibacter cinnamivorans]SMC38356.1 Protein of unknown function [Papillibacter cinnamivorans DSM 12816]